MTFYSTQRPWLSLLCLMFCPAIALSSSGNKAVSRTFVPSMKDSSLSFQSSRSVNSISLHKGYYDGRLFNRNLMLELRGGEIIVDELADVVEIADESSSYVAEEVVVLDAVMEEEKVELMMEQYEEIEGQNNNDNDNEVVKMSSSTASLLAPVTGAFQCFGSAYATSLNVRPILTKSVTACFIFALSDYVAQRLERSNAEKEQASSPDVSNKKKASKAVNNNVVVASIVYNWTRTLTSAAVGLLYFGPAAHAWYGTIFKLLPGTSLFSILQKAALGQILFGPSFTCVFFATSLIQSGDFTIRNWFQKIRNDLPGAWMAGLGFWPLVDLVSYSYIPGQWIPLFVNFCSFIWTIYLSTIANRTPTLSKND